MRKKYTCLSFAALVMVPLGSSLAQTPPALEEIVVTAQRREESLRSVPLSVVAVDGNAIDAQNIREAQDYLMLTPNVSFSEEAQGGARNLTVSIRGVNNISVLENRGGGSAIGYYFDEISLGQVSQGTANPQLLDIERVEVLRGPQGTFFGLNATGGALNVLTRAPSDKFFGQARFDVGNLEHWGASGIVNAPVSEKVYLRAAGSIEDTPAVVKNANPVGGDSSSRNSTVRLSARFLPSDKLDIIGRVTYSTERQGLEELVSTCRLSRSAQNLLSLDQGVKTRGAPVPVAVGINGFVNEGLGCFPQNDDTVNKSVRAPDGSRAREQYDTDNVLASGTVTYKSENFEIKSVTGYIDTEVDAHFDLDGTSLRYINRRNELNTEAWSEELRVSGSVGNFDWLFGGIYFNSDQSRFNIITADDDPFFVFPPRSTANEFFQTTKIDTYAVFADASLHATDQVTLIVGGRYSDSDNKQCAENRSPGAVIPFFCAPAAKTKDFSPRVVAQMDLSSEVMGYVSASRGYKPGGVQVEGSQFQGKYQPSYFPKETLWNYEAGIKASLFDNRLLFNAAVFTMDWRNLQVDDSVFTVNPVTLRTETSTAIRSAKKATSKGIELDLVAQVTEALQAGGGLGYTNARFGSFNGVARPQGAGPVDLTHERIPGSPEWTGNAFAEYQFGADMADSYIRAEVMYRDQSVPNLDGYFYKVTNPAILGFIQNDGNPYPFVVPSFTVVNFRAGVTVVDWQITAYVENAFKENYFTGARFGFNATGVQVRPHPRLFGLQLSRSW